MYRNVSFHTLGCRLNQAETAIMQRSFEAQGFTIVKTDGAADIVVVNTCTVTEHGDQDTRKIVHRINRINPKARIALVGCQSQLQREILLALPNVHWVVGNARKMELADIIQAGQGNAEPQVITPTITRTRFTMPFAGIDREHTRANLKIQDGCDFFCSFCVIPYVRGRGRSRQFDDIIQEARILADAGHQELVLTGINVGTYADENRTIVDVIETLESIAGIQRIRISSIELRTIAPRLVQKIVSNSKLCRFLHIPLQSGADDILTAMNRRYQAQEYISQINHIVQMAPEICLGTDVMVGFPGETDSHFAMTAEVLRQLPLAYFHVFSYSERQHAKSRRLPNPVARQIIDRRSATLRSLSSQKRQDYLAKFLGTTELVLFEQQKNGLWTGLTDTYIRVKVQSELDLHNRLLPVRLEKMDNQALIGILE